jgi:ribonuclease HI
MNKNNEPVYHAFIDGAASGNPGDAGVGVVIYKDNEVFLKKSIYIGSTTNNVAEYMALLELLNLAKENKIKKITVYTDSELLERQLNGMYKVRDKKLKNLYYEVMDYKKIIDFNVLHIGREKNKEADKLAKNASKMNKNKTYYEN